MRNIGSTNYNAMVTKLDVTFDVDKAIEYFKEVERTCEEVKWEMPEDFYVETFRSLYGWSLTAPRDGNPNEPSAIYKTIKIMGLDNYQETKAAFGFGKSLMNMFPMAYRVSLGVSPPGSYMTPHRDFDPKRDALRGWIPFITDSSMKWITEEGVFCFEPGNVYIIDVAKEHAFINEGTIDGVGMSFDIYRSDFEQVKQISGIIE